MYAPHIALTCWGTLVTWLFRHHWEGKEYHGIHIALLFCLMLNHMKGHERFDKLGAMRFATKQYFGLKNKLISGEPVPIWEKRCSWCRVFSLLMTRIFWSKSSAIVEVHMSSNDNHSACSDDVKSSTVYIYEAMDMTMVH